MGDVDGKSERLAEPHLEPQRQIVGAMLQRKRRVTRQMRQAGFMRGDMILLRGVTIRYPDVWLMDAKHRLQDAEAARIIGRMHDRIRQ